MKRDTLPARRRVRERILWAVVTIATTAVLAAFRPEIDGAHVALAYLLIVLGATARGGRRLGLALALILFLAFNFLFIPPYYTFVIQQPVDWLVLFAFLIASAVANQLLHRAQREAQLAENRAEEIDRLASLGAEALNAGRAEDAVTAVAQVIQAGLAVDCCEIYLREAENSEIRRVARVARDAIAVPSAEPSENLLQRAVAGLTVGERADGSAFIAGQDGRLTTAARFLSRETRSLLMPLSVRGEVIGVLRLADPDGIVLDPARQRFGEALAYYAALALDRVRLSASAEHGEALREADRLKDALLASVSHDLRTPLTTIKALAHDIAAEGDERAVVVEEEADRMNRFVSNLLDLSRLNAGAIQLAPELTAAEDVLGAALQRVSATAGAQNINASIDQTVPILVGRFDFVHTLRALVNLIENALKYSPAAAGIDVSVHRAGEWLAFEVADRGPGIGADDGARIFEPFFRGQSVTDAGGTGLGLAISRHLAELQGGRLTYSPRAGGGSVFTLLLPAMDEPYPAQISL